MVLDFKNIHVLPIIIYFAISLIIFVIGVKIVYDEKKSSIFSSLFLIAGHFLLVFIPTIIFLGFLIQNELNNQSQTVVEYISRPNYYLNSLGIIVCFFGIFIFLHFSFFILNLDNMQDVSKIPENIKNKTCGWICPSGLYDTFYFTRGSYPIFEIMNFSISICSILASLFLLYSSFSMFYPANLWDAIIVSVVRSVPIFVILILTLWGKITSLKETLHLLISDGYWGSISMNIINTGYFYSFIIILALLYLLLLKPNFIL